VGIYHLRPIAGHRDRMEPFERMMKQFLLPKLQSLANVGTDLIFWLNQYPVLLLEHITYFLGEWLIYTIYKSICVTQYVQILYLYTGVQQLQKIFIKSTM